MKKKKNNSNTCQNCIWWKSEEMYGKPEKRNKHYCPLQGYTKANYTCSGFKKELFEATKDSISTEELNIDLDLKLERDKLK